MGKPLEIVLDPPDNGRLANLCGVLDENLRQIATAYDVEISRRGDPHASTNCRQSAAP